MRISGIPFHEANSTNYTKGRSKPIRKLTIHHTAGWENTLRYLWADPNRNGSSTFFVGNKPGQIEQYVDTDDTPWTNGNFSSNSESLTVETRGDWRGYYDQGTIDNLYALMLKLIKIWPNLVLEFHMDVSSTVTLCPADLKHKGYAKKEFDKAVAVINKPAPTPTPPKGITYRPITPKRVKLIRTASLWDFNFTSWANAKAVKTYGAGEVIDVVAVAKNVLGGEYYMTAYSYNNGAIRSTNGFNMVDCVDYVPQITLPPTIEAKWEPMLTPRKLVTDLDVFVTDLDTMKNVGTIIPEGTEVEMVEKKTTKDNILWIRSKWAKDNNKNWGIRMDHLREVSLEVPEPPREPVPEPPIDVDPTTPGNGDIESKINYIIQLLNKILSFFGIK